MLTIKLHFPHNRFCLGWEIMYKDEEYDTNVIVLFLLFMTLEFEF
jgi:hypothetical protein